MIDIRSKYHIALNDIGLVLQNAPETPAYVVEQAAVFSNRFASGDRSYDDFSKWWFWAQTDWYQGIKDSTSWEDDGKYYFSTNIDTWSEIGAMKLAPKPVLHGAFNEDIFCGHQGEVNGTVSMFVGTDDDGSGYPKVYQWNGSAWVDIATTNIGTNQNIVSQMSARSGKLWVSTVGSGTTDVVCYWNGSSWVDVSGAIGTLVPYNLMASRCHIDIGGTQYIFIDNHLNDWWALVSTSVAAPTVSGDFTVVFQKTSDTTVPVACAEYLGKLYYLVTNTGLYADLRCYDIALDEDSLVRRFKGASVTTWGVGDKLLTPHNDSLIITIPNEEIWQLRGTTLTRIYKRDAFKNNNWIGIATPKLLFGAVVSDNKIWWGNLMYDGERFYNTFRPLSDLSYEEVYPQFVDSSDLIYFNSTNGNTDNLYYINVKSSSSFKGETDDANYLIMNNFDNVSGIDKLLYSVTLIFKKFSTSQSIEVEYTTGELTSSTSWTALGAASATLDGTSVTEKTLYFPINTTCKKIWYRIKLQSDGTNTPVLYDVVTAYLPRPFADKQWRINVDCGNEIKLLNGSLENNPGREIKGALEQAWISNQIVDFQDVDYASTTITDNPLSSTATTINVADTSHFPEVGRLKTEDEVIYYTGKTPKSFTGCTRGRKATKAVAHSNGVTIHNGYKVLINSFNARVPIINNDKDLEYSVGLSLREVI